MRLAARDCAGDAAAEPVFEVAPEAMREAVLRDTVLLLSRALLRRSRMVIFRFRRFLPNLLLERVVGFGPIRQQYELAFQMRGTRVKDAVIATVRSL